LQKIAFKERVNVFIKIIPGSPADFVRLFDYLGNLALTASEFI
jgi:hypothetical protein